MRKYVYLGGLVGQNWKEDFKRKLWGLLFKCLSIKWVEQQRIKHCSLFFPVQPFLTPCVTRGCFFVFNQHVTCGCCSSCKYKKYQPLFISKSNNMWTRVSSYHVRALITKYGSHQNKNKIKDITPATLCILFPSSSSHAFFPERVFQVTKIQLLYKV